MESYEASKKVFNKIQSIDPENASKIMGYILLNHDNNYMLHLSSDNNNNSLLINLINTAKIHLGLSSNTLSALQNNPISNPIPISKPNPLSISLSLPRLSNGFDPLSPSSPSIWSPHHVSMNSNNNGGNFLDEFNVKDQNFSSFVNDPDNLQSKNGEFLHRKSLSFNDNMLFYGNDDLISGFGIKPCLYYSKGFCKNGSNCNFVHGNNDNYDYEVGFEQDEIFRSKFAHQQHRLATQLMTNGVNLPYNKLNFLHSEAQRSAAALMMSEDFHKLNRLRMARNEFSGMDCNPSSRQIYLTFPADSTFKEEDVSGYFNKFGPVQDVRIPYQQKRMFGFVTFVFPETVRIILAKGNPHFVCESRVLVKPYKEKGKLPDKKQHQHQLERGDFSCSSPSGHECREPYDFQLGGRMMMYSPQEMLLRKKLEEQADLQHALELQERRLMNLQLLDFKAHQHHNHVSVGSPIPSPNMSSLVSTTQTSLLPSNGISHDVSEGKKDGPNEDDEVKIGEEVNTLHNEGNVLKKEDNSPNHEDNEFFESFDHVLPDNLFSSPTKSSSDVRPASASFSSALPELDNGASSTESMSLSKAPLKSCFFEMPRISNGHGAIGM